MKPCRVNRLTTINRMIPKSGYRFSEKIMRQQNRAFDSEFGLCSAGTENTGQGDAK
jgi:hypothetical protein